MQLLRLDSWGCAPQARAWGPPGPQDPRPETLSLDSEAMQEANAHMVAHASRAACGDPI